MKMTCCLGLLLLTVTGRSQGPAQASIPAGVAILVDGNAAEPVMVAVGDLERDLENVLGKSSTVYRTDTASAAATKKSETSVKNYKGGLVLVITDDATGGSPYSEGLKDAESHSVSLVAGQLDAAGPQRMVLQGADMRGTIYAIYEFSDSILGVPPLYRWTGWTPPATKLSQIEIEPGYRKEFAAPAVKYRGLFPNDTDLFAPWTNEYPASRDMVLETMMRLKYNLMDVGSISDVPASGNGNAQQSGGLKWALACQKRGLLVTFTHTAPFGAGFGDWDKFWNYKNGGNQPGHKPASIKDQAALNTFWTHYIKLAMANHLETIQTIAFRGNGDKPWWDNMRADDPGNDAARADVVARELQNQMALYSEVTGQKDALMRLVLYDEIHDFITEPGVKFFPANSADNPNLIWNFANTQRDHFPAADVQGYGPKGYPNYATQMVGNYENIQYTSTGSHLTSNEGPWKLEANQRYLTMKAAPGKYVFTILNSGNFREFTMEIAAGASVMWKGVGPGGYTTDSFMPAFAGRYFVQASAPGVADAVEICKGTTLCTEIAGTYREYYDDQWHMRPGDFPGQTFPNQYVFQDLRYAKAIERLMKDIEDGCYANASKCAAMKGVAQPFSGKNPFTGTAQYPHYLDVVAEKGSDQLDTTIKATGVEATKFDATLNRCVDEQSKVSAGAAVFLEDSLCSNAEMMKELNLVLGYLAVANKHVDDPDHAVMYDLLVKAQAAFEDFRHAYQKRSTAAPFQDWYNEGRMHSFEVPRVSDDLNALVAKYSKR